MGNQFVKISEIRVSPSVCIGVHPWFYSLTVCTGTAESGVFLLVSLK